MGLVEDNRGEDIIKHKFVMIATARGPFSTQVHALDDFGDVWTHSCDGWKRLTTKRLPEVEGV